MTNTLFNVNLEGKVEAKLGNVVKVNNQTKYQAIATDITDSVTKGWSVTFLPTVTSTGKVVDYAKSVNNVTISNFSAIKNLVFATIASYVQNPQNAATTSPVVFESEGDPFRITIKKQKNSLLVTLRVKDVSSPFYMLALEFVVTPDTNNPNVPYIVGESDNYNKEKDEFFSYSTFFVGRKRMFVEVYKNGNEHNLSAAILSAKGPKTYNIDRQNTTIQYIQKVDSIYKAHAYIIEDSVLMFLINKLGAEILNIHNNNNNAVAPQKNNQNIASNGFASFFAASTPQNQQAAPVYSQQQQQSAGIQQSWSTNQYVSPAVSNEITHEFDLGSPTTK